MGMCIRLGHGRDARGTTSVPLVGAAGWEALMDFRFAICDCLGLEIQIENRNSKI